jgi:glutamyl-tRNA reductase
VEQNRAERLQEAEKAERMVVEEVGTLREWMKSLEVTPTIVALRSRVDEIKRAEIEKVIGRLAHLSPQDRELVEGLASSIVNKLIHSTMVTLKSEVNSAGGAAYVDAARRFFNLDQSSPMNKLDEEGDRARCPGLQAAEPAQPAPETVSRKRTS